MKSLASSLVIVALAFSASAQTPTTPTKFGTAATGTGASGTGAPGAPATTPPAKPLSVTDKKFVKDSTEGILIEQKYLALVVDNKTATVSEEMKKATGTMAGELKRVWTALATLATTKGAEVAQEVSKNDVAKVQKVSKEKPDKFDKEFYKELGKEAKGMTKLFESGKTLQDPDLKKFVEDWATVIKGHEAAMEAAEKALAKKK